MARRVYGNFSDFGLEPVTTVAAATSVVGSITSLFGQKDRWREPAPTTLNGKPKLVDENGAFSLSKNTLVVYGNPKGSTVQIFPPGTHMCSNSTFGKDPFPGGKGCYGVDGSTSPTGALPAEQQVVNQAAAGIGTQAGVLSGLGNLPPWALPILIGGGFLLFMLSKSGGRRR